jgi:hypothetical protein
LQGASKVHDKLRSFYTFRHFCGIITVGTSGITNQSAAFDPYPDVGPVYINAKRLQLTRDTLDPIPKEYNV